MRRWCQALARVVTFVLSLASVSYAHAQRDAYAFGILAPSNRTDASEAQWQDAITASDADNLAFVVSNGIKTRNESCEDPLLEQRKAILDHAKNGIVVALTAQDWTRCKRNDGKSNDIERLTRMREMLYADEFSLGATRIPVVRESNVPKFRSYVENARWEIGDILYATIDIPSDNNHYRTEAGRNSEFEDRLVANRNWLQRLFTLATTRKMSAIVLFCDGNPLHKADPKRANDPAAKRDGYSETRQQLATLVENFSGKVLIVHGVSDGTGNDKQIVWHNGLGELTLVQLWTKVTVRHEGGVKFLLDTQGK